MARSRRAGRQSTIGWPWSRLRAHDLDMKSRVYPKYKTKYRVANWPKYERALVQRGDVTLWLSTDAIAAWRPPPSGHPGGQKKFSNHAIETALTLRLVFRLPLRQAEGFLRSVLSLMDVDLEAPDHTTLSRRSQDLEVWCRRIPATGPVDLMVDSTGLSIVGEGEWAAAKHGGRGQRGWKKLHLGVDRSGVIVAQALTDPTVDDATIGVDLIEAVNDDIGRVTADAAYDTIAFYNTAAARGATVVVPPNRTARVSRRRPRSSARDRTIKRVTQIGRRLWKKESGYHRQARVENASFRYKSILGDALRARSPHGRVAEARVACNVLNQMTALGRPESYSIGRWKGLWFGIVVGESRFMHQRPIGATEDSHSTRAGPLGAGQRSDLTTAEREGLNRLLVCTAPSGVRLDRVARGGRGDSTIRSCADLLDILPECGRRPSAQVLGPARLMGTDRVT